MKRLPLCLMALLLLTTIAAGAVDIYVAPNGSDTNDGNINSPLATVGAALRKARELRRQNDAGIANGIHIILKGGTYTLLEPLVLRPEDAGTMESSTWIEAAPNEKV